MDWWDAFDLPDGTAAEVAVKMRAILEATNEFYKWSDQENYKRPFVGELANAVLTLALEISKLKERLVE